MLRADQIEAADDITRVLAREDRTILTMACGTGKTRTSGEIGRRLAPRTQLRTFPSLALIAQSVAELARTFGRDSLGRVVAVCSDRKILARHQGELDAAMATVTSDPAELTALVRAPGTVTVFCTLQSLDVLIAAHADHGLPAWGLTTVDEAHRTVGVEDRLWAAVHDQARVPAEKRVSMTATMKIVTSRAAEGRDDVVSMHDTKVFGPVGHRLTYGKAVQLRIVAPYRLVVPVITQEAVREAATAVDDPVYFSTGANAVSAPVLATQIALLRAAAEHGSRRMVTYHRTIADAKWFATTLPLALRHLEPSQRPAALWAGHVHGGQSTAHRERVLDRLRSDEPGLIVVANAHVLTEGVNIPAIDSVGLLCPRGEVDIIQAIGRAGRLPDPGVDKTALVFAPAVMGPDEDPTEALYGSAYATAYGVVRALAAQDEDLALSLDQARRSMGRASYGDRSGGRETMPHWLSVTGIEVPPGFASAITVQVVRAATAPWEEYLGAASAFHAEHGHLRLRRDWSTPAGLAVGRWLEYQRTRHAQGRLTAEQTGQLEALGVVWNEYEHGWSQFVADLTEYRAEFGNLDVPQSYVNAAGRPLGSQVGTRRTTFAELSPERARQLLDLDFVVNSRDHRWDRHFDAWLAYQRQHGTPVVPRDHVTADGLPLGAWRIVQIKQLRADTMPADRAQRITARHLQLSGPQARYQANVDVLRDFRRRHGHARVRHDHVLDDGTRFGEWFQRQQRALRDGTLTAEQAKTLLALGVAPAARKAGAR
ncbi:Helicase associated domain protein [Kitasatospora sp. NPDC047058]|uniref:DEAD/DEAH box helicase n=1 Tax=Kitasatospora sp. NPDC047058 TaxID=3155620 RepID=UPI0033DBFAD4